MYQSDNCSVWSQIHRSLANCRTVFASNQEVSDGLKGLALALVSAGVERMGWEFHDHDDFSTIQLRKLLLGMAAGAGHKE